jgi:hypothetical protein
MTTQTLAATKRPSLLWLALKLDALVTGANGVAYLVLAGPLGDLFGLDAGLLRGIGAGLVAFAAAVWIVAARPTRPAVLAVIAANVAWVAGSVVTALAGWGSPETVGTVWIALQAAVVAGFAELQVAGLRRWLG